jgi:hypothetical protein
VDKLDDKGNVIFRKYVSTQKRDDAGYFTYDEFDERGNWTKRTIRSKDDKTLPPNRIEYRRIAYYPAKK